MFVPPTAYDFASVAYFFALFSLSFAFNSLFLAFVALSFAFLADSLASCADAAASATYSLIFFKTETGNVPSASETLFIIKGNADFL